MNSRIFRNLAPPSAPRDLKARVLEACLSARARSPRHWVDRAWESSQLRLAWALTILVLLFSSVAAERSAQVASPRRAPAVSASVDNTDLGEAGLFGSARSKTFLTLASTHSLLADDFEDLAP